jgi:hypothetical protein
MKILTRTLTLLALPLLPFTSAVAGVNPAIVAADAQWLVHVDLNTLRQSVVGKELLALAEKAKFDTGQGKIGIDWKKFSETIGSATAYGSTLSPDPKQMDGALVIQGTADLRKIAESLLIQANLANPKEIAELTDLPFPAYGLYPGAKPKASKDGKEAKPADDAKAAAAPEVVIAFPPEPIILVSKSKAQLLKARDVFRGAAPSLAKSSTELAKFVKGSEGAYLFAASLVPAEKFFPAEGPQTRILKMASSGALAIGERNTDTFGRADLVASSDAMADKLQKIVQGMTAMMSLAESNDKALADFLSSANVTREGKTVSLSLAYSSARLSQMIKSLEQEANRPREQPAAPSLLSGRALAEWKAEPGPATPAGQPDPLAWRTIENVTLRNGNLITLGTANNGGKSVRFDRVEIVAVDGGAPLIFKPEFMRTTGPRGNLRQLQFPGADGNYTLKVAYVNDPEGKATYAVSMRDARINPVPSDSSAQPAAPQPKK